MYTSNNVYIPCMHYSCVHADVCIYKFIHTYVYFVKNTHFALSLHTMYTLETWHVYFK
ncbi:Cytochrome bc1 complex cytochrome b subunit [Frankliniella fusca]|uniref:Cytochrome bc1 complex cytochrome b subunit n=1 Tax=Frankliniella fusca TaxID=407009 RepID=A0AAE1GRK2_9NEOP|nr:Cytochrome bc1 complex cytochrome b subunit [Frankliniella fusca]